jgi:hypothetical protein
VRLSHAVAARPGEAGVIGCVLSGSVGEPIPGLAVSPAFRRAWSATPKPIERAGPRPFAWPARCPPTSPVTASPMHFMRG